MSGSHDLGSAQHLAQGGDHAPLRSSPGCHGSADPPKHWTAGTIAGLYPATGFQQSAHAPVLSSVQFWQCAHRPATFAQHGSQFFSGVKGMLGAPDALTVMSPHWVHTCGVCSESHRKPIT